MLVPPGILRGDRTLLPLPTPLPHALYGSLDPRADPRVEERRLRCDQDMVYTKILKLSFYHPYPCDEN